jgi:hypothetical protein
MSFIFAIELMIDCHKPLTGRSEYDWVVASPTVRVTVMDGLLPYQGAAGLERFDHGFVAVPDGLPLELRACISCEFTCIINW